MPTASGPEPVVVPFLPWTGERFIPTEGGPEIYYEHSHRYMLARSALAGRKVVDLASGEGYGAAWIAEVAAMVVGVDIDAASVRHASARYGSHENLRFAQADIEALPLADNSVDAVTCFEAIEHVPNPRRVMEEAVRILKPGGLFFVSTPNKALYTDARDFNNEFHVHEFYLPDFERLLKEFFPAHWLLGQRVVAGSLTWPLSEGDEAGAEKDALGVLVAPGFDGGEGPGANDPPMIEPMYVVACCQRTETSGELPLPRSSVLVDPEEILLNSFRRTADPAAVEASLTSLEDQRRQIEVLHSRLQETEGQLESSFREVLRLRRTVHDYLGTLRLKEEDSARLRDDLRAATELSTRLLAEIEAGQRAIVELHLSSSSPESRVPARSFTSQTKRPLLRLARPLLGRLQQRAESS